MVSRPKNVYRTSTYAVMVPSMADATATMDATITLFTRPLARPAVLQIRL